MTRILTGIQPSGTLHIGNYFGAMRPLIAMQDRGQVIGIIVDLHALTSLRDADALRANTRNAVVDFMACGLDPERSIFFRQSDVAAHAELMWVLSCITPMPMLELATSYKDKVARGLVANAGLFTYPVLQAADILLYDADVVPVGKDQRQHLEMSRDIAAKFNAQYGETLKQPKAEISDDVAVIPGLDGQKMSKSYGNTLEMFQDDKPLRKRVMSVVTDSTALEDPKPTEGSNILALYRLVASPEEVARMEADFRAGGIGYGEFKKRLFESIQEYFAPMRARRAEILARPGFVDEVLEDGARRAREIADATMDRVRSAVGLR